MGKQALGTKSFALDFYSRVNLPYEWTNYRAGSQLKIMISYHLRYSCQPERILAQELPQVLPECI